MNLNDRGPARTAPEFATLPIGGFAFPGPLRDRLIASILDGGDGYHCGLTNRLAPYELSDSGRRRTRIT